MIAELEIELTGTMVVMCAWCNRQTGVKQCVAAHDGQVSHGMCEACYATVIGEALAINEGDRK